MRGSEAREGFHHFLDSSGLEGELTDMEILAFEERFMEEMQVPQYEVVETRM